MPVTIAGSQAECEGSIRRAGARNTLGCDSPFSMSFVQEDLTLPTAPEKAAITKESGPASRCPGNSRNRRYAPTRTARIGCRSRSSG